MKNLNFAFLLFAITTILLSGCVKDDFIDDRVNPVLRFTNSIDSIEIDTEFQLTTLFSNNVGKEETPNLTWTSSDPDVIAVSSTGLISAISPGTAVIEISYTTSEGIDLSDQMQIVVGESTVIVEIEERTGIIETTTFYLLEGTFKMQALDTGNGVIIDIDETYRADTGLPGLYVYLSNNPNSIANALEIGAVSVFEGAHSYEVPNVDLNEYNFLLYFCKPFNVKVGDGDIN